MTHANNAGDLFAARVLDHTRAASLLAALTAEIDSLKASLKSALNQRDDNLTTQLETFRTAAVDQWLNGPGHGMDAANYDHARTAAVARARSLQRHALNAAETAEALAFMLEAADALVTVEDLAWRIDTAAAQYRDGKWTTDAAASPELTALWQSLTPSALIGPAEADHLRRHFDTAITAPYTGTGMRTLTAAVADWRRDHARTAAWDGPTFDYAVATVRGWGEVAELWNRLGDPNGRGHLTPGHHMRLRTALVARVNAGADSRTPAPRALAEAAHEFDTGRMWLLTRIRSAETMADLHTVAQVVIDGSLDYSDELAIMRALTRKFDVLTGAAPDADPEGNDWAPAAILATTVTRWRADTYTAALECTGASGGRGYTEEDRYQLLDCALADARHTGHTGNVNNLLDRVAAAGAEHILTADHIEKLRAGFTQNDTAAINIGGTN